jgi:hypothetical protein
MSQENVEALKRGVDAYNRRDIGALLDELARQAGASCPVRRPARSDECSGRLLAVKGGGVGDADDQAILGEKPSHRLSPGFGAGRVQ